MFKQKEIYRPNVGIIIINTEGNLMWCRRKNHDGWQFPQGGIDENESPIEAAIREVEEETGLAEQDLNFIWESKSWFFYDVPKERRNNYFIGKNKFIGQRQKWFLAEIKSGHEKNINLSKNLPIEFDDFIWVTYWYPLREVVSFKKEVYRELLIELLPKYIEINK